MVKKNAWGMMDFLFIRKSICLSEICIMRENSMGKFITVRTDQYYEQYSMVY